MADNEQNSQNTAKVIYIMFMANIVIQFLSIIGVIFAYVYRKDAPDWLKAHYQFQIYTFWIDILLLIIAGILFSIGVGLIIWLFRVVWLIIRCVKGMKYLDQKQAHPKPTTWMFG